LTGELRHVPHADRREAEAAKFGLDPVVSPTDRTSTLADALSTALEGLDPSGSEPAAVARAAA